MAFEFIAPISAECVPFAKLAGRLEKEGVCVIESVSSVAAQLRRLETQRREEWPEDAQLSVGEDGLLLMIHAGTQQQRNRLVESVAAIASELLCEPVTFEEV